jgi:hypothetical protein
MSGKVIEDIRRCLRNIGAKPTPLYRYLDTDGDGTGTKNANGDYSGGEEIFYIQPPAGQIYNLNRMIVTVYDTTVIQAEEYGNLGAALGTGIVIRVSDDNGVLLDLTDGIPITTNAEWTQLCYDADVKAWGSGNELVTVRWTFVKAGYPLRLVGDNNERLEVVLNDALDGLLSHYFMVQGYEESVP